MLYTFYEDWNDYRLAMLESIKLGHEKSIETLKKDLVEKEKDI